MKDRIKQYIDYKGITAGELAVMLDVQRSNISHILNGRNKPGAALIEKLLLVFPDLNARWLLTGKGNMSEHISDKKNELSVSLPLFAENEPEKEKKHVEKVQKAETKVSSVSDSDDRDDSVDRMILLYKDGTFATYRNRDKK